jgi:transketolase
VVGVVSDGNARRKRGVLGEPAVTLDDIRHFRQLDSKAPGHPEYHWVSGVETTTGPLGQGIATSVGMAIARKWLASCYNMPSFDLFDYNIYTVCGDGCLMEGVGSEAASLAGHLALDDLCWIYDNNHITIDGQTRITFTEDLPRASSPIIGMCCGSVMPTILRASRMHSPSSARPKTGRR